MFPLNTRPKSLAYIILVCFTFPLHSSQFEILRPTSSWLWRTSSDTRSLSSAKRGTLYDLGIGKNKPVTTKAHSNVTQKKRVYKIGNTTDEQQKHIYQATNYWCEHLAVHDIPNPLLVQPATKKKRKELTPLIPHRLAADFLAIHHTEEHSRATITAKAPVNDFDLNTPWVEMLIHEQQVKAAAA